LRTDATVVRQPADGACLFHSLAHGLQTPGVNATTLRARVAAWVQVTVTGGGVVCSVLIWGGGLLSLWKQMLSPLALDAPA
jgi:hypothetical protein